MTDYSKHNQLTCFHDRISLVYLKNSTSIRCVQCKGVLGEYRNDIPEAVNYDKLIYRRLYVFGSVWNLSDKDLKKWI